MELKDLIVDKKSAWVEYAGLEGFEVEIVNLSRQELTKLRKRCTVTKFDRKSRFPVETLDEDIFVRDFAAASIKNWKGLTIEHLETLILVDVNGKDPKEEVTFSTDNAIILVKGSNEFDTWLNEVIFDLDNFRTK